MSKSILLISGHSSTGKTTTTRNIKKMLCSAGFTLNNSKKTGIPWWDKIYHFSGLNSRNKPVEIIINTASDDDGVLDKFEESINENDFDIIITAIRDYGDMRKKMLKILKRFITNDNFLLELPLGKINRKRSHFKRLLQWYEKTVANLSRHILTQAPFYLNI